MLKNIKTKHFLNIERNNFEHFPYLSLVTDLGLGSGHTSGHEPKSHVTL